MPELLNKLYELQQMKAGAVDLSDIQKQLDSMPRLDNDSVLSSINNAMMGFFNRHYELETGRKESIVKEIIEQIESDIVKVARAHQSSFDKVTSLLEKAAKSIAKDVKDVEAALKEVNTSGVTNLDKAIKGIKPTDVSNLEKDIKALTAAIVALKSKKPPKQKELDISPIIKAIEQPKSKIVEFELIYDSYGLPEKVIATETTKVTK
ncbi:MAG: hypothetical protein WBN37_04155 [Arenicellales bacterium]